METVRASSLSIRIGNQETPIINNVSFSLKKGEALLVIGPTGSGKSTLLLTLAGVIPELLNGDVRGEIKVAGHDPVMEGLRGLSGDVGIVFQDPESQVIMDTVYEEVAFPLENFLFDRNRIGEKVVKCLENYNLLHFSQEQTDILSTGLKQRLALASVLCFEPKVLLLDEPTAHIDPMSSIKVYELLKKYKERGGTLIVVEHRLDYLLGLVDKVLFLYKGTGRLFSSFRELMNTIPLESLANAGIWLPFTLLPTRTSTRLIKENKPQEGKDGEPIIRVKNLTVRLDENLILKNISFETKSRSLLVIIGPNGSGKTTLLKVLAGLIKRYQGDVSILGRPPSLHATAYVSQIPEHQFTERTVVEEVASTLLQRKVAKKDALSIARGELEKRGLGYLSDRGVYEISQGEKRLVSLIEMELLDRPVYLLDEPTFGLDFKYTMHAVEWINRLVVEGKTVVLVTHDAWLLLLFNAKIIGLSNGEIIFQGSFKELLTRRSIWEDLNFSPPSDLLNIENLDRLDYLIEETHSKVFSYYEARVRQLP